MHNYRLPCVFGLDSGLDKSAARSVLGRFRFDWFGGGGTCSIVFKNSEYSDYERGTLAWVGALDRYFTVNDSPPPKASSDGSSKFNI